MDIRLLGDVEVEAGGVTYALDRSAERGVLATLAFNAGRFVPLGTLVAHVWGAHPPPKAEETVATYVRSVRRLVERAGGGSETIRNRRLEGYRLDVDPDAVDHRRFTDLVTAGRALSRSGDAGRALSRSGDAGRALSREGDGARAIERFERALRLWRGEALANVTGQWAESRRYALRRERLAVTYELLDLLLRAGAHDTVAARAADLVHDEPTERGIALALRGLAGSGQRAVIPSFLAQAGERMWEVSQTRPSADLVALARRLAKEDAAPPPRRQPAGTVVMTVHDATNVYQSAGDQYFIG